MAKKETEAKIVLERVYNAPLRREFMKVPRYKRSKKAVTALTQFIAKHMKSDNVLVGKYVNQFIWKDGIQNPPHHVKVNAVKDDKGNVKVELAELPAKAKREIEEAKEMEKEVKEKKTKKEEEKKEKDAKEEKIEEKLEESKEEKAEKAKEIEKEEIKELQKEHPKIHQLKAPPKSKVQESHPQAPRSQ